MLKYILGLVAAVAAFFGFVYLHFQMRGQMGDGDLLPFFIILGLVIGLLVCLAVGCALRMNRAEETFTQLLRAFISQVGWVHMDASRVSSLASSLLTESRDGLCKAVTGKSRRRYKRQALRAISDEIARVAREDATHAACLRFLRETEVSIERVRSSY